MTYRGRRLACGYREFACAVAMMLVAGPTFGQPNVVEATAPASEAEALRAVEEGVTPLAVRHLEPYRNVATRRVLERLLAASESEPDVRRVAAEVLVAQLTISPPTPRSPEHERTVAAIAADPRWSRALRTDAMRALIDAYLRDSACEAGRGVIERAGAPAPGEKPAPDRALAAEVLARAIELRPGDIESLAAHEQPVVREFASRQAKAWRREDPQMDFRDIALLLEWKAQRTKSLEEKIERAERRVKHAKPGDIHIDETPTAELARLKVAAAELRRARVLDMAVRTLDVYYNAMVGIKHGERRSRDRVEEASTPRDRVYEFAFDETEWRRMPSGEWNEVKVGESSVHIDLDKILGPRPAPTERELAQLGAPDVRHRAAIASAEHAVANLFRLTPETLDRALDGYVKWFNEDAARDYRERKKAARPKEYVQQAAVINKQMLIPLPPRP